MRIQVKMKLKITVNQCVYHHLHISHVIQLQKTGGGLTALLLGGVSPEEEEDDDDDEGEYVAPQPTKPAPSKKRQIEETDNDADTENDTKKPRVRDEQT